MLANVSTGFLIRNALSTGFLIRNALNTADLEMIISEMKTYALRRADAAFKRLVEWQTERVVDEIALNMFPRPEDRTILDIAAGETRRRVFYAEKTMQNTEFNLYLGIQVMTGKIGGKPATYLETIGQREIYGKVFRKIKELEPYDMNEDDLKNVKGEKRAFHQELMAKYGGIMPLSCSLATCEELRFNPDDLKFRSPYERAADIAAEKCLNRLLASYACDQEIPPNKLMEYVTFAANRLADKEWSEVLKIETANLERILPVIDIAMITETHLPCPAPERVPSSETEDGTQVLAETENPEAEPQMTEDSETSQLPTTYPPSGS